MEKSIAAADANRRFSRLLREVQAGDSFVVTARGRPRAVRVALDTNILASAEGVNTAEQLAAATALVARLPPDRTVLPAQVLGEVFTLPTRKSRLPPQEARLLVARWMTTYEVIATSADVLDEAFELAGSHHLAGWDSLVLAAAAKAGCRYLLSEDLHDGFAWRGVSLVNPFAARPLPASLGALLAKRGQRSCQAGRMPTIGPP
jgi:predicted nucleic acid-binding protein